MKTAVAMQIKCLPLLSVKISNFRICFCCFDLSCSILEKENVIENLYLVLYCLIAFPFFFFFFLITQTSVNSAFFSAVI